MLKVVEAVSDIRPSNDTNTVPDVSILIYFNVAPELIPLLFEKESSSR
jgi:hypothetical protein